MIGFGQQSELSYWMLEGFLDEQGALREVSIATFPFRVGRRADLPLFLNHSAVSKLHAELEVRDGVLWLTDLGSTNGTFCNGERITSCPLQDGDIVHFAKAEFRVRRKAHRDNGSTRAETANEWISLLTQFDRLFEDGGALPHYQPIVDMNDGQVVGYEVLGRSPLAGLTMPRDMFGMAERLGMQGELSRLFRRLGMLEAANLGRNTNIFLNTHPAELEQKDLILSLEELRAEFPWQTITLEVHEGAIADLQVMRELRATLNAFGMSLAYDDFGAGQSRLVELVECPPDYLKLDMSLVRAIHKAAPTRQRLVATLVQVSHDAGITILAEGIENAEEANYCRALGVKLAQGYHYGRPAQASAWATIGEPSDPAPR